MTKSAPDAGPSSSKALRQKVQLGGKSAFRRWATRIVVLLVLVGIGVGVQRWRANSSSADVPTYETKPIVRSDLRGTVSATGTVRGRDTVQIGAQVSGTVKSVLVDYNDPVTVGQVLAEIDPDQLSAAVDQARAQIASAQASHESAVASAKEARATADRNIALAEKGLISEQELELSIAQADKAAAAIKSAAAQIESGRAAHSSARANLDRALIKSPLDGVVLDRTVEVGQTLASSLQAPVLFTLARDLAEMELSVPIDEADVGRVHEQQKATFTVDAFPRRKFSAELKLMRNISVTTDNVVTYEALLRVDNDKGLLRPGMTATATIVTEERDDALLVPNAALRFAPPQSKERDAKQQSLQMFGGRRARPRSSAQPDKPDEPKESIARGRVWVLEGGEPKPVHVKLGISDGTSTEVLEGVEEGMEVIVDMIEGDS